MKSSIPIILCLVAFVTVTVEAQILPFRSYSIEKGLSEAVVNDLMQDTEGFIWIATSYGLNRFNGIEFENYYEENGLLSNKIHSLYQDRGGTLWIGTGDGVNLIEQDSIITRTELDPLRSSTILEIYQDTQGDYWFATDGQGVWNWNSSVGLTQYGALHGLAGDRVRDVVEDKEGTLWFGTREGLTSLKEGNFRSYRMEDGLPDNKIRDLMIDDRDRLWIATRGGLSHFSDGRFHNYTATDGLINDRVQSISPDGNGGLWIGTEEGASHLQDGSFSNYSVEKGLSNNIIYSTLFDREQNIWFGTFGGGVNLFLGDYMYSYTVEQGLPNNVITSITQDSEGNHWISSYGGGISRYDGDSFTTFDEEGGLVDNKVYTMILDSRNRILVGTRWGLSIYNGRSFYNFDETELPYRKIRAIMERRTGQEYWLGTYGEGALIYRNNRFSHITEDDGLSNNTVMAIEEDDTGRLWFATYGGVSRYGAGSFRNFTIEDGLPNNGVLDLHTDQYGNIWASTFGGLARYDSEDDRFVPITAEDGLPDEVGYFLLQDERGIFWVGTNKGVVRFDYDQYREGTGFEEKSRAFKLITQDQGLVANEMNAGAAFLDREGMLWFGSVGGVSRMNPSREKINRAPPKIHIETIRVSERPVQKFRDLRVGSDERNIMIEYIGINFTAPEQVIYQYRLRHSGERWQRTNQRRVRYSALLPGDYVFQVRARSSDGVWSSETATVTFTVLAPFWMQWWFILLVLAILGGVIYFIYHYYRVRKMFEIERMRVRIASDLHDDVGSSLTEIALQSDFLQTSDLDSEIKKSLKQIGEQSRKIVSSLDDIVWSIDARNDTLGDLTDRMQDYVNNLLPDKEIIFRFDEVDMNEKLTVPLKENIYLIFKEAVNNIAKHSGADRVEVELKSRNNSFDLFIRDDGSGIMPDARKSGQGLRNMKMRAERIDAQLDFENGSGFTVHVYGKRI